ncbi:MAG: hypothetical protein ACXIVG_14560 [Pararhodobacter sp.]
MRAVGFLVYATVVTLLPAVMALFHHGANAAFIFLTGDAYLYLGIARHSPPDFYSFDGMRATNGFHPFWQYHVWLMTELFRDRPLMVMNVVAWSAIVLAWVGAVLGGLAAQRLSGSWALACLVTPGAYFLLIGQSMGNMSVWEMFNGMEAGLSFALAGGIMLLVAQASRYGERLLYWLVMGVLLAALVFSRLDEVFVVAAIMLALVLWPDRSHWRGGVQAVVLVLPVALMLALYFAYNLDQVGTLMPVSGAAKGEGSLFSNSWVTLLTFFSPVVELREGVTAYSADRVALGGAAFRVAQLLVPAFLAVLLLLTILRFFAARAWAPILAGAMGGIIIKALYSFVFAGYWHQAPWYFAFACMALSVTLAAVLGPSFARLHGVAPALTRGIAVFLVAFGLFHASKPGLQAAERMTDTDAGERMAFWNARAALEQTLRAAEPDIRLLEFGDGMLGFSLDFPTRHGFVFAGDVGSLTALQAGRLLRDSYADGFRVLAAYEYLRVPPQAAAWGSEQIRDYLAESHLDPRIKAELPLFDFEMIHIDAPTGIGFIRMIERGAEAGTADAMIDTDDTNPDQDAARP